MNEKIFEALKKCIVNYVDGISEDEIEMQDSLSGLGLDSIERGDVLVDLMDELGVKIPLIEFKNASNIEGIISVIAQKNM